MIVITCLDQKNGMMFNHRRQSQDSVLREHVAKLVANVPLWMNHYSASQFDTESIPNLNIDDAFLQEAAQGEYCFVEDAPLAPFEKWIERIVIFRWGRRRARHRKIHAAAANMRQYPGREDPVCDR